MDLVSIAGGALAGAAAAVARLREAKPLHPAGAVLPGHLVRRGQQGTGVEWLDTPGEDQVTVRLSRSAGVPPPFPDVQGLAVRAVLPGTGQVDLLLATTGLRPGARHVLLPRRQPGAGAYTSLVPFAAPGGPMLLAAVPDPPRRLPPTPTDLTAALAEAPFELRLGWARPTGPWHAFGHLTVGGAVPAPVDPPLRLDPLLTPPGLTTYPWVVRLREPAYAAARRGWPARTAAHLDESPVPPRR